MFISDEYHFFDIPYITPASGNYYILNQHQVFTIFGKAISSDIQDDIFTTHLKGSSNKGVVFSSGKYLNMVSGVDFGDLIDSTAYDVTKQNNARGFYINKPRGIIEGEDSYFAANLC